MPTRPVLLAALIASPAAAAADPVTFEKDVRPVLAKHCATCHGGDRPRGELDLTGFGGVMLGGLSGKAVVPGKPQDSPLYTTAAHLDDPKMPPNKPKIPQRELDLIRDWVAGGAVEKAGGAAAVAAPAAALGGLVKAELMPRATPVTALAVSPTAPVAAVAGRKQVLLFEPATAKSLGALAFPEGEVHVLRFSRDGKVLLAGGGVGGQSGKVVGFDTASWKRAFEIGGESDAVLAADLSADGTRLVLGGPGKVVKVFSVPDGKPLHAFRKPTDWVLSVGFSPEGLLVAAGDRFGGLYVWEAKSGKEFHTLRGHTKGVTAVGWRADSDALASCSEDGTVRVWDMHRGTETARWDAHPDGALDLHYHPNGLIATAGRDGRVRAWDAAGKPAADLGPTSDAALKVALTADAKAAVAGDWAGGVKAWPLGGGAAVTFALPLDPKPTPTAAVPVAVPAAPTAAARPATPKGVEAAPADLARKRAALKAVEAAAERMKDEAARSPKNPALAKAYLQLCEAALAMKAEVLEAEAAAGGR